MQEIRKILVPVDFSACSRAAALYARSLAEQFRAQTTLFHVAGAVELEYSMSEPGREPLKDLAEARRRSLGLAMDNFPSPDWTGPEVIREVGVGEPAEEILRKANEGRFDMIVMPTRGAGPVRRWLLIGSVAAHVLSGADCTVVTGVEFPTHPVTFGEGHIVCAVDLEEGWERPLAWACELARKHHARLSVVHASPAPGEVAGDLLDESWRATLHARLEGKIQELLCAEGVKARVVIEAGAPHKVIPQAAEDSAATLVVLGRSNEHDLFGRLRATAYEIIRRSPCPVARV